MKPLTAQQAAHHAALGSIRREPLGEVAAPSSASPRRKSMIAKIHVAKTQLRMADDDYREILLSKAKVLSSKEASDAGLEAVLAELVRLGFKLLPAKKPGKARAADHPTARKARALWISLYQLGVVRSPDEASLEAFAKRQLKVERMQWADQSTGYRLIEALKAMAERAGWSQELAPYEDHRTLKDRLVVAILGKLKAAGAVGEDWTVEIAMQRLFGETVYWHKAESVELAAVSLGAKLREVTT